ncbi:hypothetical protein H8R18_02460 [Nanchangia anserum]|uniref:alpha/beta hydrolase n=1 Tax=Nanchangia anserum TaxID=2692125 RepID=UPI00188380B6|nr:alpha/beta hydrolase-fold protein [Nanchangia anserum]QOX82231.1 hypothetical protein H8R18_02460 [Nanchangia anserum]
MLTSLTTVIVSWVVVCLVFAGGIWVFGRVGRWAWIGRLGAVVLTCVCLVCAIGLTINRPMGYVSDPGDLMRLVSPSHTDDLSPAEVGTPPTPAPAASLGPLTELPTSTAPVRSSSAERAKWNPDWHDEGGGVRSAKWTGPTSKATELVRVWTPRGYSPTDKQRYSVIVFLHGSPGSPQGVIESLDARRQLQDLIDRKVIPPSIFVVPRSTSPRSPSCADIPGKPQAQKWLSVDIPTMIRTQFPNVATERANWLVMGISSGAYCAGRTALVHPDLGCGRGAVGVRLPLVGPWVRARRSWDGPTPCPSCSRASARSPCGCICRARSPIRIPSTSPHDRDGTSAFRRSDLHHITPGRT